MYIHEIIMACYIFCFAGIAAGLTCGVLSHLHRKTEVNKAVVVFLIGLMVICFYDMGLYYCNYVVALFSCMEVMRIGNSLIAITMFLWLRLQKQILDREAIHSLDKMVGGYMLAYAAAWLLISFVVPMGQLCTIKWIFLAGDAVLVISFLASSVAHIIYASVSDVKKSVSYMTVTTAMLVWNYFSYFWGGASACWGNGQFVREPLDLTILFWMIISVLTASFVYYNCFKPTFAASLPGAASPPDAAPPDDASPPEAASPLETVSPPGAGVPLQTVLTDFEKRLSEVADRYNLTRREREVTELICQGKSNKDIAEILFLSESTVKTHIYNIFRKLEVKNRIEAIRIVSGD